MAKAKTPTEAFLETDDMLATKPKGLERHPLSEKYGPPLSEEELQGLSDDIKQHGQHDMIKLYEGKVLAGWNRYRACAMAGVEPRVEQYTGDAPESVAFSTNVMRRRLSSISKAYMGAMYYMASKAKNAGVKQQDIAKQCNVSLNRLNQCKQLLELDTEEAVQVRERLQNDPDITGHNFDEMLLECGIARSTPKQPSNVKPIRDGMPIDADDDDLSDLSDDDLTGGAIDGLLDGDDDLADPEPRQRKEVEGDDTVPPVGVRRPTATKPTETILSRLAKAFKGLSAAEHVEFVTFTWGKLQGALNTAIASGKVTYTAPEGKVPKAKGAAYVAAKKAAEPPKPAKKAAKPAAKKAAAKK